MILAIDCGNSRVKWGLGRPPGRGQLTDWHACGATGIQDIHRLDAAWPRTNPPSRVMISHVANEATREALTGLIVRLSVPVEWVVPGVSRCGVTNRYSDPSRLGSDRWAAMIGARNLCEGACLVVMAGTATTVDMLDESGVFRGGIILPGIELMKRGLAEGTSGLPYAQGCYEATPRNTADAIESGCLNAQVGAIERMALMLPEGAPCLISGGDAPRIAHCLTIAHRHIDNLVLEGLAVMGGQL